VGFKWGFPLCLRGPLGLSPTVYNIEKFTLRFIQSHVLKEALVY
jgi:hypothetical protein